MKSLTLLVSLAFLSSSVLAAAITSSRIIVPDAPYNGSVTAQLTSEAFGLDGPKLDHVNSTAFDWWYFDVVAPDLKSSIVIAFFTTTAGGFPIISSTTDVTSAYIWYSFPNGTTGSMSFTADEAVVTTLGDGSSGRWAESGWVGAPDLSSYVVTINSPGIVGTMILNSAAPAHYPCSPVEAGQTLEVGPNIGWANAVPDAEGLADFEINGDALKFTGRGYHDKNWSAQTFLLNVGSWFWGHGTLGEWSIVWFDFLAPNGTEYISSYASRNGIIVAASCESGSISVRPSGVNSTYPPTIYSGSPGGFSIQLDLGDEGSMGVNVTGETITVEVGNEYTRWLGGMEGSINGGEVLTGIALYEEFRTQT